jgi:hypothetical protein
MAARFSARGSGIMGAMLESGQPGSWHVFVVGHCVDQHIINIGPNAGAVKIAEFIVTRGNAGAWLRLV